MPKGPQGQKRPADTVANAIRVAKIRLAEIEENTGGSGKVQGGPPEGGEVQAGTGGGGARWSRRSGVLAETARSLRNDRHTRLSASQGLELEKAQRREVRDPQPPDLGSHAREGPAGRAPPPAAVLAGHAERREGHGDARRAPCRRP